MKVGLLTLPLLYNYGAILQAYALHKVINDMGLECTLIDKQLPIYPYYRRPLTIINRIFKRIRYNDKIEIFPYWMTKKDQVTISRNTRKFVESHISPKTAPIECLSNKNDNYDVYVVGSDQVWRRSIVLNIENYLFDFVSDDKKKIAYAASFGVDYWEFKKTKTNRIIKLMSRFHTITVREDSAVKLIKNKLGFESVQVLDPTMLLTKEDYVSIIGERKPNNGIFSYILDLSPENKKYENYLHELLECPIIDILPHRELSYFKSTKKSIYPSLEQWLSGIANCRYVITDSFHGTVFSIIFNKPFVVLQNNKRGNTRIESLLKLFNLQSRALNTPQSLNIINTPIDWDEVNNIWENERIRCWRVLYTMLLD